MTDMTIEGQYCLSVGIQTGGDLLPKAVCVSPSAEWDIQAGQVKTGRCASKIQPLCGGHCGNWGALNQTDTSYKLGMYPGPFQPDQYPINNSTPSNQNTVHTAMILAFDS